MIGLIIALMIALGGGVSVAAEKSVPGDVLYGVKTHVNEQIRGMVATSDKARAEWEAELAQRRLEEAAKLKAEGNLDAEVATELNTEFAEHVSAALDAATSAEADDDDNNTDDDANFASEIETRMKADSEVFANLFRVATGDVNGDGRAEVKAFVLPHVLEQADGTVTARDSASGQATGKRVMTADVDGDGRADVADHSDSGAPAGGSANTEGKTGSASVRGGIKVDVGE